MTDSATYKSAALRFATCGSCTMANCRATEGSCKLPPKHRSQRRAMLQSFAQTVLRRISKTAASLGGISKTAEVHRLTSRWNFGQGVSLEMVRVVTAGDHLTGEVIPSDVT